MTSKGEKGSALEQKNIHTNGDCESVHKFVCGTWPVEVNPQRCAPFNSHWKTITEVVLPPEALSPGTREQHSRHSNRNQRQEVSGARVRFVVLVTPCLLKLAKSSSAEGTFPTSTGTKQKLCHILVSRGNVSWIDKSTRNAKQIKTKHVINPNSNTRGRQPAQHAPRRATVSAATTPPGGRRQGRERQIEAGGGAVAATEPLVDDVEELDAVHEVVGQPLLQHPE